MEEKRENKKTLGSFGEKLALEYLVKNKFEILDQNFRAGRFGEVDIIAREGEYICFIEVKTRTSTYFGMPSEAVNYKKQQKILMLAHIYLRNHRLKDVNVRFDVVEVLVQKSKEELQLKSINLIRNAFIERGRL